MKNLLKKAGADPTVAAKNGCTALDLALLIEDTDTDAIRLLAQETVSIAPPLMSFLPPSRPVSKLSRSISTPIFVPKHDKNWWDRFSSIFKKSKSKVNCYINTFQPPILDSELTNFTNFTKKILWFLRGCKVFLIFQINS